MLLNKILHFYWLTYREWQPADKILGGIFFPSSHALLYSSEVCPFSKLGIIMIVSKHSGFIILFFMWKSAYFVL